MRNDLQYDPHNIESILIHRKFIELTEEERGVVMNEISSESEYEALRSTLLQIRSSFAEEETFLPDADIKSSLMASFEQRASQRKNSGWWESLFPSGRNIFLSPGFQLASIALIVTSVGIFYFNNSSDKNSGGLAHSKEEKLIPEKEGKITESKENIPLPGVAESDLEEPAKDLDDADKSGEEVLATDELKNTVTGNTVIEEKSLFTEPMVKTDEMVDMRSQVVSDSSFVSTFTENYADNNRYRNEQNANVAQGGVTLKEVSSRRDIESEKQEFSKAKRSNVKTEMAEEDLEQRGIPANKNPQLLELLFTSL